MTETDEDSDKRDRSPKFPYINLTLAIERCRQTYIASKGNAVRLIDAAGDWGVSYTSSSTLRIAAALLAYGLIADEGSGDSRKIRLTPDAIRILNDSRPGVKESLLAEAALRSPIIEEYYIKWGRDRPTDGHAVSSLKFDSRFTERAARTFLGVYDDIITYIPAHQQIETTSQSSQTTETEETSQNPAEDRTPGRAEQAVSRAVAPVMYNESEWLRVRVSKDVTARIMVDGALNPRMIERLITVLNAQKEVMDDDF
jgi:hypothetical protein